MITREMTIGEVIREHPEAITIFKSFGMNCVECQVAAFGSIEQGASVHKVDVETLIAELNKVIGEG
jgi:hybrid cluster-associated redox disulfide protein